MTRVAFTVPVAPLGTNHAYKPARWGRRHGFAKTEEANEYQRQIRAASESAMGNRTPFAGPCEVMLTFVWPHRRADVDSATKLTLDSLQGAVLVNDRQVRRLVVEKALDKERPRVEVVVVEEAAQESASLPERAPESAPPAQPATPEPAALHGPASALTENVHALLFTGRKPFRQRTLNAQRRLKSSRKDYRP